MVKCSGTTISFFFTLSGSSPARRVVKWGDSFSFFFIRKFSGSERTQARLSRIIDLSVGGEVPGFSRSAPFLGQEEPVPGYGDRFASLLNKLDNDGDGKADIDEAKVTITKFAQRHQGLAGGFVGGALLGYRLA